MKYINADQNAAPNPLQRSLPLVVFLLLGTLTLLLWHTLSEQERLEQQRLVSSQALTLSSFVESDMENRISAYEE